MIVYTSIENLQLREHETESYKELGEEFSEWVEETTIKFLSRRNEAEVKAGELLEKMFVNVDKQPFFKINNRSYFLDYFIEDKNLAIEIDGGYHKLIKESDKQRDADFFSIGIRTVRLNAEKVLSKGITLGELCNFTISKNKKHKKHKRKKKQCYNSILNKTHRKVSGCKMVYDANYMI